MRYIKKSSTEPTCLSEYKQECKDLNVPTPLLYEDFNRTSELKRILSQEQHGVCCYCQRAVRGFRIEHSYPESSKEDPEKGKQLQLDYYNLFAACMDSQGHQPELQYCDVAKGNQIIREFIKESNPLCQLHFKYLSTGEIVPHGQFSRWKEYLEAAAESLTLDEKDARRAIEVLNLNCHTLVEARKLCLTELLRLLPTKSKDEWKEMIRQWMSSSVFPDFIELRLQYIYLYLSRQP